MTGTRCQSDDVFETAVRSPVGTLTYTRRADGRLVGMRFGETVYLAQRGAWAHWGNDFARWREERVTGGVLRTVEAAGETWRERYLWDQTDRLVHIDGVAIRRDPGGGVIACLPDGEDPAPSSHRWLYHYAKGGLAGIETPAGYRAVALRDRGRPAAWSGVDRGVCAYDDEGHRRIPPLPQHLVRDAAGRVWGELDANGELAATYLWDGHRCLARVDEPLGGPLAAVFCLDPSGTPVRAITADGVRRLPRDAFGEGLLPFARVPGVFGAYQAHGLAYLPWRTFDPRLGAFCSPDPFNGDEHDPRRGPRAAYTGPLTVEPEEQEPYAIARHDPIGRADPTGAISGLLLLSDFTWSWQNNLLAFFGIDWWFNLLFSLFTGFQLGDFGSSEGLSSSERLGAFGIRRDGFVAWMTGGRAFTTQHLVWAPAAGEFETLKQGWVIDPQGRFDPTLYGTLLKAEPDEQMAFLLRGMRDPGNGLAGAANWTRQGGIADFAAPNCPRPVFPSGGFHLDGNPLPFTGNRNCPVTELDPAPGLAVGTLAQRATSVLPSSGLVPEAGDLALLSDADGDLVLTSIVTSTLISGLRFVRFEDDAPAIGPLNVTLELIDPTPVSSEARATAPAAAAPANALTAVGTTATYAAGDLLRLTASTAEVTVARVDRLEARLPLNAALPGAMTAPIVLTRMVVAASGPNGTMVSSTTADFSGAASPPAAGTLGLIVDPSGNNPAPVRINNADDPAAVVLDTDISGTHGGGAAVQFRPATAQNDIGRRTDAVEAAAQVTYTPGRAGAAPDGSSARVVLRAAGGGLEVLRLVPAAPVYDAIVANRTIAGTGPWTVERLRCKPGTSVQTGLVVSPAVSFTSPDAGDLDGMAALRFIRVEAAGGAPAPTAAPQLAALSATPAAGGAPASASASLPQANLGSEPRPGQPVVLSSGGTNPLAVVTAVRVTPTLDRAIAGLSADGMRCVRLMEVGPTYTAERLGPNQLALNPEITFAGGTAAVDFPRFCEHEVVRVTRVDPVTPTTHHFSIDQVRGGRLDLDANSTLPGAAGDALEVRRMVPDDPGNGHWLLGRNGRQVAADRIRFDVTRPDVFPDGRVLGIIDRDRTWPATVTAANRDIEVVFAADPGLAAGANVNLAGLRVRASQDVATFVREGQAIVAPVDIANLSTGANEAAVVQAFTASSQTAANARLSPGTLLVPNDEDVEVDRRQALVDHELAHTLQYARWGPLWFCYFPVLLLELPIELATDTELPDYGPFAPGRLEASGTQWRLVLDSRGAIAVGENDRLQVVQGGNIQQLRVVSVGEDGGIVLRMNTDRDAAPPTGRVQARRLNNARGWDEFFAVVQFLTHGGLLNGVVGTTWASVIWLLAKGIYGVHRAIAGTGDLYPATVENNGIHLRLSTDAGRQAITSDGRISVKQGETVLVREAAISNDVLVVTPPVAMTGTVQVALYDTHDPGSAFDWYSYYAAEVPDTDNAFVISVPGHGTDFSPLDRVEVRYQDQSFRTEVTRRENDTVELARRIPLNGAETSLRIAKIGESDPMGNADGFLMTELGMDWMRWLFDPWGQFDRAVEFDNEWLNLIPRGLRYLLGTQMFSILPPAFGYVFWGRFFVAEHLAKIEQEASGESGDLYTPLSRLTGQVAKTDTYGSYRMVVGDIARFRFWTTFRNRSLINRTRQMAPGVHPANADLRVIVHRTDTGAAGVAANDPNDRTNSGTGPNNTPARAVADLFADKPTADATQLDATVAGPTALTYSELAQVPERPTTLRHRSIYAAFTQPGQHRLTVVNQIDGADGSRQARDAQERERQTVYFNIEALDVTVRVAGTTVAEGDTVDLVAMQRASVTVTVPDGAPAGPRRWRLTVRRPEQGDRLRQPGDLELQVRAIVGATETVEVSRFYPFDAANNRYSDGGLAKFGLHLGGNGDIAVRRFTVNVINALPLRGSADAAAAVLASLAQGADGILLIPAPVVSPPAVASFDGRAHAPAVGGDPAFTVELITALPAAVRAFLGAEGQAYRLGFAATPALAADVAVRVEVVVGEPAPGTQATLVSTFTLTPAA